MTLSPNTIAAKKRMREMMSQMKKVENRVKKFKYNSNNSNNTVHVGSNNFKNKLNNMKNPVYLVSDVFFTNGKINHVYEKNYLTKFNKLFKKNNPYDLPRAPLSGRIMLINSMKNYRTNVKINEKKVKNFKDERKNLINKYGEGNYSRYLFKKHFNGALDIKKIENEIKIIKDFLKYYISFDANRTLKQVYYMGGFKPYHFDFMKKHKKWTKLLYKFIPFNVKYDKIKNIWELSEKELKELDDIYEKYKKLKHSKNATVQKSFWNTKARLIMIKNYKSAWRHSNF